MNALAYIVLGNDLIGNVVELAIFVVAVYVIVKVIQKL